MFFGYFFTLSLLFSSFGIVASVPSTAGVRKRQNTADIENIFSALESSTNTILPQITTLGRSGNASNTNITPLVDDLTTALSTASSSLSSLATSSRKSRRQSDDDVANLVAGIITDIANALKTLLGDTAAIPNLGSLIGDVDTALNEVLSGLETLLAGVLTLVASLLVDVAGLLQSLSLSLTFASLGL
ncbi:hypothetical protein BDP27DRAFT_1330833 [Rhodocollybia butyracea]|uniref:Sc15 protein n=1 Tax=Rhodocollybia butyracea TaxID=206335 RepID=A0A9P5PQW2_9AGAR|nr:hypothetical protein BDP27DRAFT_1330833 [Rhodocollybia butyracea]